MEVIDSTMDSSLILSEERPYRKCPHCGEYQFTQFKKKKWVPDESSILERIIRFNWAGHYETVKEWEKCHNCHFTQ